MPGTNIESYIVEDGVIVQKRDKIVLSRKNADALILGGPAAEGGDIKVYRDGSGNLQLFVDADAASNAKALDLYGGAVFQNYLTVGKNTLATDTVFNVTGTAKITEELYVTSDILPNGDIKLITGKGLIGRYNNEASLVANIYVSGTDSTNHDVKLQVDSNDIIVARATGDGAGGVTDLKGIAKEPFCLEKGLCKNRHAVAASTYSSTIYDCIIGVPYTATGAVTITLPSAGALIEGHYVTIVDEGGNANNNNITIDTEGAETISGAATQTINAAYGRIRIYADGANWFLN